MHEKPFFTERPDLVLFEILLPSLYFSLYQQLLLMPRPLCAYAMSSLAFLLLIIFHRSPRSDVPHYDEFDGPFEANGK